MSGGKETPRQKMIGMMYLVLTALLALNVSKEILNAFVIVENGLNTTNKVFDGKNSVLYTKFDKSLADNKDKAQPFYNKAQEIKKKSVELTKMVDDIRSDLYLQVQKLPSKQVADTFKLAMLDSKDNFDIPTHYMLGDNPEEPGAETPSIKLKEAIKKFKDDILKTPTGLKPEQVKIYEKEVKNIKLGLDIDDVYSTSDEKKVHWEFNNFDHTTMAADMCIFAAIKNDIKNAESDVVGLLLKSISAQDFSFDAVEAKVVAPTSYINSGENFTADIFISAHSSTQNPEIKITSGGGTVNVTGGVGKYVVPTSTEGFQNYAGTINVKAPDGTVKAYPFSGSYMVAKPSLAISPTKMNVFYIGVENPVDISVAGAGPSQIHPSITGGSITPKGGGHFIVKVNTPGDCKISVSVDTKDGLKPFGAPQVFRVKKVPSPLASFAGVTGDGKVSKGELQSAGGLIPKLEDFVFDLKFPVVSWVMSMNVNGAFVDYQATGPGVTGQMKDLLTRAKSGGKVLIEQVKVQAPDGVRSIPGCVLKIK